MSLIINFMGFLEATVALVIKELFFRDKYCVPKAVILLMNFVIIFLCIELPKYFLKINFEIDIFVIIGIILSIIVNNKFIVCDDKQRANIRKS